MCVMDPVLPPISFHTPSSCLKSDYCCYCAIWQHQLSYSWQRIANSAYYGFCVTATPFCHLSLGLKSACYYYCYFAMWQRQLLNCKTQALPIEVLLKFLCNYFLTMTEAIIVWENMKLTIFLSAIGEWFIIAKKTI